MNTYFFFELVPIGCAGPKVKPSEVATPEGGVLEPAARLTEPLICSVVTPSDSVAVAVATRVSDTPAAVVAGH